MLKKYIIFGFFAALLFSACDEKTIDPVLSFNTPPTITSPASGLAIVLEEANADAPFGSFSWTAADFGYQAAVNYSLQVDSEGANFTDPKSIVSTTNLSVEDITVGAVNNTLLSKGLPFGFANPLEIRVCANIGSDVVPFCSDAIAINITPYRADIIYPSLNVPGDYQGWDPGNPETALFSRVNSEEYEGYIHFENEEAFFKFAKGSWAENWGDSEQDGVLEFDGGDIPTMEGSGLYYFFTDLNTLTYIMEKRTWGVLGSATPTGTSDDTELLWDTDRGVLSITLDLTAGSLRFRANDDDTKNFGDDFANGTLEVDGEDIMITDPGNYTIDLILTKSEYAVELTKN